ncbi:MAG: DUF1311 domain-containing protein [Rhodospirillales bacterium]|nr:DUF1311 domain-containing protein [Rhodospirillales bacterium]
MYPMGIAAAICTAALAAAGAHAQSNPSFDCRRAATVVERMICAEASLGEADRTLARAYREALESRRTPADRDALARDQADWLTTRDRGCLDENGPRAPMPPPDMRGWIASCLEIMHNYRISWLLDMPTRETVPGAPGARSPGLSGDFSGRYTAGGDGWYGALRLRRLGGQWLGEISTTNGPTAHSCGLEGKVRAAGDGLVMDVYENDDKPDDAKRCAVKITPIPGGFEVEAQENETCRMFCGARGYFSGEYFRTERNPR